MLQNEIYLEILHHNVSKKYCKKKLLSYQIRKKAAFKTINRKFLIAILPVFFFIFIATKSGNKSVFGNKSENLSRISYYNWSIYQLIHQLTTSIDLVAVRLMYNLVGDRSRF